MNQRLSPVIEIEQGKLRGIIENDLNGNDYFSFKGIPFAKPPIGHLRFLAPEPAEKFNEEVYEAIQCKDGCSQINLFTKQFSGSDDCLYLNVYTPQLPPAKLLPVLVYICGGAFQFGSGSDKFFGPGNLVTKDVLVVTLNYRVNILGFLTLNNPDLKVTGNQGLKDQLEALKWINKNIKNFGGDPSNVTLMGQSAGAASVHLHMFSPKSKNLFHKIILHSGCGIPKWATNGSLDVPILMKLFGFNSRSESDFLEFLRQLDDRQIQTILSKLQSSEYKNLNDISILPFGPTIEKNHVDAFLTESPIQLLKRGEYQKVPMLMGLNKDEGFIFSLDCFTYNKLSESKEALVPKILKDKCNKKIYEQILNDVERFYFSSLDQGLHFPNDLFRVSNFLSDIMFKYHSIKAARLHSKIQNEPIYFYYLRVNTKLNYKCNLLKLDQLEFLKKQDLNDLTIHSDDLPYLWINSSIPINNYKSDIENKLSDIILTFWTNFVKFSNPNVVKNGQPDIWIPLERGQVNYLDISNEGVKIEENMLKENVQLWDEVYKLIEDDI